MRWVAGPKLSQAEMKIYDVFAPEEDEMKEKLPEHETRSWSIIDNYFNF